MFLVVGLGNPGAKYKFTRHNIGFMVIDAMLSAYGQPPMRNEHKAEVTKVHLDGQAVLFAKPQTFMNLSGESVQSLINYYEIKLNQLLVIHDDVDLPFGQIRLQRSRGHGGQNGVRDIHAKLGTNEYSRLKVGVGRPTNPKQDVASYVLQNFSEQETAELHDLLSHCAQTVDSFIFDGFDKAATKFNTAR